MANKRDFKGCVMSRLSRIERKCDLIISELLAERESARYEGDKVDDAIDRIHEVAKSLREQSRMDRIYLRDKFGH